MLPSSVQFPFIHAASSLWRIKTAFFELFKDWKWNLLSCHYATVKTIFLSCFSAIGYNMFFKNN